MNTYLFIETYQVSGQPRIHDLFPTDIRSETLLSHIHMQTPFMAHTYIYHENGQVQRPAEPSFYALAHN